MITAATLPRHELNGLSVRVVDADESDGEDVERVLVDGSRLVARPARRTERGGDSRWR